MLTAAHDTNADTEHFALDQHNALRNASDVAYLRWLARIERTGSWEHDGVSSIEGWVAIRFGRTIHTAREEVALSRRLDDLPAVFSAYADGLLSREKVVALCSFLEPEQDEAWALEAQGYSASWISRCARAARRIKREEAAEIDRRRELTMFFVGDVLKIAGEIPGADGALVKKAFERIAGEPQTDLEGRFVPIKERYADALVALASVKLGADADTMRSTVVVHCDARELNRVHGVASLDDGPLVSSEVARRLSCNGYAQMMIEAEDGRCVGIGRRSRIIPKPLMWKVRERDRVCVCCGNDFLLPTEGHHVIPWAQGGGTDLENLVLVCLRCHRYLHERGYRVFWKDDGTVGVRRKDGTVVNNRPTPLDPKIRDRFFGPPLRSVAQRK
jgi:5-methylcytosine-specific restriction endonuclease McrA